MAGMGVQWTIGEAGERLAELVAAAQRGEEVVLERDGQAVARIVGLPISRRLTREEKEERAARRRAAFGMFAKSFEGVDTLIGPSMTDEEYDERVRRKFGPPA